jgi:CRISPR-associated protein Cmr5
MQLTNRQKMAQAAYAAVCRRLENNVLPEQYASFARSFPSLIHSCGLAQAVAFAQAKGSPEKGKEKKPQGKYLDDLATVLAAVGHADAATGDKLAIVTRESPVSAYVRLSRDALQVAGWLKRYVEAHQPDADKSE